MTPMVYVRMLIHRTGGRHDGKEWPPYLGEIDLPDWEADDMVRHGTAEYLDAASLNRGYDVLKVPAVDFESYLSRLDGEDGEEEPTALSSTDLDDDWEDDDFDRNGDDFDREVTAPVKKAMKRPTTVDNKASWIEWAVYNGAAEATATAQTKAQLIAEYGTL